MSEEKKDIRTQEVIDLSKILKKIWSNKRVFYKVLPIVFVLSCIYIFSLPRYYTSEIKLAPEIENPMTGGTLGALASSFGFDLSSMQATDAITPLLYPDLMEDNGFVYNLLKIKVESKDGEIKTEYHDYLKKYQKKAWWQYFTDWVKNLLPEKKEGIGNKAGYDPYYISEVENGLYVKARDNINITIDKKTGVITISAKAQDALICKTLADSIKNKLQIFITEYRTNKSRTDYEYYKKLTLEAKNDYDKTRHQYARFSDANTDVSLRSVSMKIEDLENEMQLKYNTFTTLNVQLQAANAKVQDRTPVFTVIKGATVPVKPAGPKRVLFTIGMLILATIITSLYLVRKDLHFSF